jgi:hypothetical protein
VRPPPDKINAKKLAISVAVVGAVAVPLFTGSLARFARHPIYPAGDTVIAASTESSIDCAINSLNKKACDQAASDPFATEHYSASLDTRRALPLLRDIAIGLVLPAFAVLVVPLMWRRYFRWLTA